MMHSGKQTMAAAGDDQCKLRTYKPGCPDGLTPHHCVPDHCFRNPPSQGGGRYPGALSNDNGLCVCVKGSGKYNSPAGPTVKRESYPSDEAHFIALAEHGRIHNLFDKAEADLGKNGKPTNSAKLGDLEDAAAKVISEVTGCDEADLKKQIRAHHQSHKLETQHKFRAEPTGSQMAPPDSMMGTNTPTVSMSVGAPG
jgi:hypothetical protein